MFQTGWRLSCCSQKSHETSNGCASELCVRGTVTGTSTRHEIAQGSGVIFRRSFSERVEQFLQNGFVHLDRRCCDPAMFQHPGTEVSEDRESIAFSREFMFRQLATIDQK